MSIMQGDEMIVGFGMVGTGIYQKDVIDNVDSNSTVLPLSANQGRILNENKADNIFYDEENSELQLKVGEKVISSSIIKTGGYIVYPEFEMNFDTGHLSAIGGAGVEFAINENGHLESEVL